MASEWLRRTVFATAVLLPSHAPAQTGTRADAALGLFDRGQCGEAIDAVNQGMRDNDAASFFIAGQLFQNGYCLLENKPRAARLYERGALLGDVASARSLALMNARGDGIAQSSALAGHWYAVMRKERLGASATAPEAFSSPDALIRTYIDAIHDLAALLVVYPADALDRKVTGTVRVQFDPRTGRVRILASSDSTGSPAGTAGPNRHDFERASLTAYADAIRLLPRPPMSASVDTTSERDVPFERRAALSGEPAGLQALPRR